MDDKEKVKAVSPVQDSLDQLESTINRIGRSLDIADLEKPTEATAPQSRIDAVVSCLQTFNERLKSIESVVEKL